MSGRAAGIVLLLTVTLGWTQPMPPEAKAPLLFVRVQGPEGMAVTFLEGTKRRTFDQPVTVGLRPFFCYRMRLHGLPDQPPEISLYPSFEVHGTLRLPCRLRAGDFPAPVAFTEADIERALAGVMVTKVILLEDADKTAGGPALSGEIPEIDVDANERLLDYAKTLGRPVLVARLGRREPEPHELARTGPGMILYPGQKSLPPLSWAQSRHAIMPDPKVRGPWDSPEECIRDGGDQGKPIYIGPGGQLEGLEPSDSVAEYRDSRGRLHLSPTNTICVFVPRFLAVRQLAPVSIYEGARELLTMRGEKKQGEMIRAEDARRTRQLEDAETMRMRQHLSATVTATPAMPIIDIRIIKAIDIDLGPATYLGTARAITLTEEQRARLSRQIQLALTFSKEVGPQGVEAGLVPQAVGSVAGLDQVKGTLEVREFVYFCKTEVPEMPDLPLKLLKWANAESAQVGDVLTFYIRYSNFGGKPIRDIAISDSLTGRLEYIPGSSKSDREAVFVTQDNGSGSLILRWEVRDPLPPGQRGVVSFQARVR